MIKNSFLKYYIGVGIIVILLIVITVISFLITGGPFLAQQTKYDNKRSEDLITIKYAIENYSRNGTNRTLPSSLDSVSLPKYTNYPDKLDPKTGIPYEYSVISPTQFQLCATFETDTSKGNKFNSGDEYTHTKGRYCFNNSI